MYHNMVCLYSPVVGNIENEILNEKDWLQNKRDILAKDQLQDGDFISWAAYHTSKQAPVSHPITINALLLLFYESAQTVVMVRDGMEVVCQAVEHLNPGKTPVLTMDQPLYILAKQIQWQWLNIHGEDHYMIMFGGVHIEMIVCRVLGTWLDGSGWTRTLVEEGIATSGTADSLLKVSHLTKTRYAHQLKAAALSVLEHQSHDQYRNLIGAYDQHITFDDWPHFLYWHLTLKLELTLFLLISAHRERNI